MGDARRLEVKPISSSDANRIVKHLHYSGKVTQNSQLHLGVFIDGRCGGAMQFGPSLDKRKLIGLVDGTLWNEFIELNRLAFADWLPRNSESRALGYVFRWMRKNYTQLKWVVSFADGTQCGDGTIYRASGFALTGITNNSTLYEFPDGERVSNLGIKTGFAWQMKRFGRRMHGEKALQEAKRLGAKKLPGFQLRYIYFLDKSARQRLAVPEIPFSEIDRRGAGMYRGVPRVRSDTGDTPSVQDGKGGSIPTRTLSDG